MHTMELSHKCVDEGDFEKHTFSVGNTEKLLYLLESGDAPSGYIEMLKCLASCVLEEMARMREEDVAIDEE